MKNVNVRNWDMLAPVVHEIEIIAHNILMSETGSKHKDPEVVRKNDIRVILAIRPMSRIIYSWFNTDNSVSVTNVSEFFLGLCRQEYDGGLHSFKSKVIDGLEAMFHLQCVKGGK